MSILLTPPEALQAIMSGKDVEVKFGKHYKWENVLPNRMLLEGLIDPEHQFRLSQETITIGDVSFPKPESKPLEVGTEYWTVNTAYSVYTMVCAYRWFDEPCDNMFLKIGLVHLSKENAVAHAKALIKLSGGTIDES